MRIGIRLTLLFVLIGLIPLGLQGYFGFQQSQRALMEDARAYVLSVGALKADALLGWMDGNLALLESVAARPLVAVYTAGMADAERGSDEWQRLHDMLVETHLRPQLTARGIEDYHIIDAETGRILAATLARNEGKFRASDEFFIEGKERTYVGRVEYHVAIEELVMHISSPIRLEDGTLVGVLSGHINLDELERVLLLSSGVTHVSEDAYVINDFSFFVTEPKYGSGYALRRTVHTKGAEASLDKETGVGIYDDYRGVEVIGSYQWVDELNLGLLVEIDLAEVLEPTHALRRTLVVLGIVVGVVVILCALLLARSLSRPIHRLVKGTEAIGRGDLDHRIPIRGKDEFSRLALSFNLMTENLHRVTASRNELDHEVKARAQAERKLQASVAALQESEAKFRLLSEASPVGVFIFSDMVLRYVNPAFERIFMRSAADVVGKLGPLDLTHDDDHEATIEHMGKYFAGATDLPPLQFRGIRSDGSFIHCEAMARQIVYEGKQALLGTIVDTTARREAESELRLKDTVFESSVAANSIADEKGIIRYANASFVRLWGYVSKDEILGRPISDFLAKDDEAVAIVTALNETGEWEGDFEALRKDGSTFISNGHATTILDEDNRMIGYQSANLDVTKQRQAEQAVRRAKEITEFIIESMPGVFYQLTPEGGFARWNRAFTQVTGYTDDEMRTASPLDFFRGADRDRIGMEIARVFDEGEGEATASFFSKDGSSRPYYFTGLRMVIDEKPYCVGMGTDISNLKEIEDQLRLSMEELQRSNKELEQFAYIASHDLQEPLRMVASYTQLLAKRYKDALDDDANDFIHYAVDGANRMQRLISDLLQYSRVQTRGKPFERVDLNSILGSARRNLSTAIDDSLAIISNDELPIVRADEGQMVSLFQNLIGNAVKFAGDDPPRVHIGATDLGDLWQFSVRDHGIGIDPEFHDRIFVIFQRLHARTEYEGTGIGLAVCRRIIERHGGRMWVESAVGEGATFFFTLPKRVKEAEGE